MERSQFMYHYTEKSIRRDLAGKWVIPRYDDTLWFFGVFNSKKALDRFAEKVGFSYKLVEKQGGLVTYICDRKFYSSENYFRSLEEIPENAKPIKALSNGGIVDCFFVNNGSEIIFYRPNPNAKEVYKPLSLTEGIEYTRKFGSF